MRRRTWWSRSRTRSIRRSTCRSMRAGGTSWRAGATAGRRSTGRRPGATPANGRAAFDLAIVSVLLDAGAGPSLALSRGRPTARTFGRSEGLALASLAMFAEGAILVRSGRSTARGRRRSRQAAAERLSPTASRCRRQTRWSGSTAALRCCGGSARSARLSPRCSAPTDTPRPGGLFDRLAGEARTTACSPRRSLRRCCEHFGRSGRRGSLWRRAARRLLAASRDRDGRRHQRPRAAAQAVAVAVLFADRAAAGAGIGVTDIDGLTGLAEYRNGGLFIDTGVLRCAIPADAAREHAVGSDWSSNGARSRSRCSTASPTSYARVSGSTPPAAARQGSAGRHLGGRPHDRARSAAPDGSPPLKVVSDGTVF